MDGIDSDVLTWLMYLSVPLPSQDYVTDVSNLVKDLKSCGAWQVMDRFFIHATEVQQHARVSLKFPESTPATEVNSPSWNFSGYAGNGTTSYVNLNYAPFSSATNMTLSSSSIGVFVVSTQVATVSDIGVLNASRNQNLLIHAVSTSTTYMDANDNSTSLFNPLLSDQRALYVANRTASNGIGCRQDMINGIQKRTQNLASTPLQPFNIYLCCRSVANNPELFTTRRQAISFFGGSIPNQELFYLSIKRFAAARGLPTI